LITGFRGENGNWTCMAVAIEEHEQLLYYSVCPVTVPEDRRSAIGEFLHRANYGLHIGNFEIDFNDGEIRFKTSIDVEGAEINAALIRNIIYMNCMMMDRYLPGVLAILHGGSTPQEAIKTVES